MDAFLTKVFNKSTQFNLVATCMNEIYLCTMDTKILIAVFFRRVYLARYS